MSLGGGWMSLVLAVPDRLLFNAHGIVKSLSGLNQHVGRLVLAQGATRRVGDYLREGVESSKGYRA
jgi:hypothetical protein